MYTQDRQVDNKSIILLYTHAHIYVMCGRDVTCIHPKMSFRQRLLFPFPPVPFLYDIRHVSTFRSIEYQRSPGFHRIEPDLTQTRNNRGTYGIICIIQFNNIYYNMFAHDADPRAVLNLLNTVAVVVVILYNSQGIGSGGCV